MPLLKGKVWASVKPIKTMGSADTVYVIPHTSEQFLSKEDFEKRQALYKEPVWTCQCTGTTKLTHKDALDSENKIRKMLHEQFPRVFERPVLEFVHRSALALESLVDESWRNLHRYLVIGEPVMLKVKAQGKTIQGTVVKVDATSVADKVICDGQEDGQQNADAPKKAPKLRQCKYGIRLDAEDKIVNNIPAEDLIRETKLPKKDTIKFFIRAHAQRSGSQLSNAWVVSDEMVSRHLLQDRLNPVVGNPIRTGVEVGVKEKISGKTKKRKNQGPIDENCQPSKKPKLNLGKQTEKNTTKKIKKNISPTGKAVKHSVQITLKQLTLLSSPESKKSNVERSRNESPLKEDSNITKGTKSKVASLLTSLKRSPSTSSVSSSEVPLARLREKTEGIKESSAEEEGKVLSGGKSGKEEADDNQCQPKTLASMNQGDTTSLTSSMVVKNADVDEDSLSEIPLSKLRRKLMKGDAAEQLTSSASPSKMKRASYGKGTGMKSSSVILYRLADDGGSSPKENHTKMSPKKRLKQMTLFDMKTSCKEPSIGTGGAKNGTDMCSSGKQVQKNPETITKKGGKRISQEPHKEALDCVVELSPLKQSQKMTPKKDLALEKVQEVSASDGKKFVSPVKTAPQKKNLPPIVQRLLKVDKDTSAHLYRMLLSRCARELSEVQINSLPEELKTLILPKFKKLKEKKILELMSPNERAAFMLKKMEELRQRLKTQAVERNKRFEDTELDLRPIPSPKLVPMPDGIANELFGDVAMVTEFISCYKPLLMPGDSNQITSDKLMAALTLGMNGFSYISKVLCLLLQTLLQDKLAEDYKELGIPLLEIPLSEYTSAELARLCLRKCDPDKKINGDKKRNSAETAAEAADDDVKSSLDEDAEVPEAIVEQLETSEFCELGAETKVQILVGLCHRIMGTYSVQDFMDEKQQQAAELWKRRLIDQKEKNDRKKSEKQNKLQKSEVQNKQSESETKAAAAGKGLAGLTINHFYGGAGKSSKPIGSGSVNDEEKKAAAAAQELDLVSVIKQRRRAAEDRKLKEAEERLQKEKEKQEIRQQKEDMLFENQFKKGVAFAKRVLRPSPLGLDRNHSRYWILDGSLPGLYVEKGWAMSEMDDVVPVDVSSPAVESDSDGRSTESGIHSRTSDLAKDNVSEKTVPPVSQNLWFVFDSADDVKTLMENLHPLGVRESKLKEALKKNLDSLLKSIDNSAKKVSEVSSVGEEMDKQALVKQLKEELLEVQQRLIQHGLGGIPDLPSWEKKLADSDKMADFVECLTDIQVSVLPRFVKGLLADQTRTQNKNVSDSQDENRSEDGTEKVEEKKDIDGLKVWLEALSHCSTFSRFHVLLGIFDSCIMWEKSTKNLKCRICRKRADDGDQLLLCDGCNRPFHLFCLRPVLLEVPRDQWCCPACKPEQSNKKVRSHQTVDEAQEDEEDEGIADVEHEQECAVCGEENDLIPCSTCQSSFHMDCHNPPLRHIPRANTWKCVQCKTGVRLRKKSKRKTATKRKHYADYITDEDELEAVAPVDARKLRKAATTSDLRRGSGSAGPEPRRSRRRHHSHDDEALSSCHQDDLDSKSSSTKSRSSKTRRDDADNQVVKESKSGAAGRGSFSRPTQSSTLSKNVFNKQAVLDLIDRLRKNRNSWPFLEPVDTADAPDYYTVVKKPVDLRTMEDKCISDIYTSSQQFLDDFVLMLQNSELYNEASSAVGKCVAPLDKYFESIVGRYLPDCSYDSQSWFASVDSTKRL